jgi:hypothetical protein
MISRELFLHSLSSLKEYLQSGDPEIGSAIEEAHRKNPWFIPEFCRHAIDAIAEEFLDETNCNHWLKQYPEPSSLSKKVVIIMAGNVPLVGFHDLFCVLASGHDAMIKLSEKDSVLPKLLLKKWIEIIPSLSASISYVDKLEGFDTVIATGSNNSARYFEYYFRNYPHILRQNRNGVAILTGEESLDDLEQLGLDIFLYYGLGCRNVSKIFVPKDFDFSVMETAFKKWNFLADHNKYRNNLDYNYAIYIINQVPLINLGHLVLKEDHAIASRIGCVHYSYYEDIDRLTEELEMKRNEIQCLVTKLPLTGWEHVLPGKTQFPKLDQYADGVDTMKFLKAL